MLDRVLAGDFMDRCWRRRFVHLPGAATALLASLPTIAEVEAALAGVVVELAAGTEFLSFPRAGEVVVRKWLRATPAQRPDDQAINVPHAERLFPRLAPLAEALARRFAAPANLQLFLGQDGAGLRAHSDIHDSFIVQVAGRKRWVVEDPEPTRTLAGNGGGSFGPGARELVLGPGDLLYKPSHGLHATASEGPTLSLTASIVTITAVEALQHWLAGLAAIDPAWRVRLPLAAGDGPALAAALAELPGLLPDLRALTSDEGDAD